MWTRILLSVALLFLPMFSEGATIGCGGAGYDLSGISTSDLVFTASNVTWRLNPCYPVTTGLCVGINATFCRNNVAVTFWRPGVEIVEWETIPDGVQSYSLSGDSCTAPFSPLLKLRSGVVRYICDASATTPTVVSVTEFVACQSIAVVRTNAVCGAPLLPTAAVGLPFVSGDCGANLYDLTSLDSTDFFFETHNVGLLYNTTYWFRPCSRVRDINCRVLQPSSFCQAEANVGYSIGDAPSAVTTYTLQPDGLLIQLQNGGLCLAQTVPFPRAATIQLQCNRTALSPVFVSFREAPRGPRGPGTNGYSHCHYTLIVQTSAVCDLKTLPSSSTGSGMPLTSTGSAPAPSSDNGSSSSPLSVVSLIASLLSLIAVIAIAFVLFRAGYCTRNSTGSDYSDRSGALLHS